MKKLKMGEDDHTQDITPTTQDTPTNSDTHANSREILHDKRTFLLHQGAEAKVYKLLFSTLPTEILPNFPTELLSHPPQYIVRKERLQKLWRHPILDTKLRKTRLKQEFNCMQKAFKAKLPVPQPYYIDKNSHFLYMEYIHGLTLKAAFRNWSIETSILVSIDILIVNYYFL